MKTKTAPANQIEELKGDAAGPDGDDKLKVLVIGGGISGLAAASALSKRFSVKVLEARDRLGGRIWSTSFAGGSAVELGASWIHGVGPGITDPEDEQGVWKGEENPVFTLAKAH